MKPRVFAFPRGTTTEQALPVIRAALEDEGLALAPAYSHGKITSVLADGLCQFKVPGERVVDPQVARELNVLAQEHYDRARAERAARVAASGAAEAST